MSNLNDLTSLIDDNIRNKTPKVVKTEHANVHQAIANTLFTPFIYSDIITFSTNFTFSYTAKKIGSLVVVNCRVMNLTATSQNIPSTPIQVPSRYRYTDTNFAMERRLQGGGIVGLFQCFINNSGFNFLAVIGPQTIVNFDFTFINNNNE